MSYIHFQAHKAKFKQPVPEYRIQASNFPPKCHFLSIMSHFYKYLRLLLILLVLAGCAATKNKTAQKTAIEQFRDCITGRVDNRQQVEEELKAGKQVHPLARHVNGVIDDKVSNLPVGRNGFFVLEESYYDYPGRPTEIKPFLFYFEAAGKHEVKLTVYQAPPGLDKEKLKNDNAELRLDFLQLKPSPSFKGAVYLLKADGCFYTHAPNDLGNGMKFTLIEKICRNEWEVMELLEKNGARLTPYETPIIYRKSN